jgi:hypothetical protein
MAAVLLSTSPDLPARPAKKLKGVPVTGRRFVILVKRTLDLAA